MLALGGRSACHLDDATEIGASLRVDVDDFFGAGGAVAAAKAQHGTPADPAARRRFHRVEERGEDDGEADEKD